jgi:hypothetical protein
MQSGLSQQQQPFNYTFPYTYFYPFGFQWAIVMIIVQFYCLIVNTLYIPLIIFLSYRNFHNNKLNYLSIFFSILSEGITHGLFELFFYIKCLGIAQILYIMRGQINKQKNIHFRNSKEKVTAFLLYSIY